MWSHCSMAARITFSSGLSARSCASHLPRDRNKTKDKPTCKQGGGRKLKTCVRQTYNFSKEIKAKHIRAPFTRTFIFHNSKTVLRSSVLSCETLHTVGHHSTALRCILWSTQTQAPVKPQQKEHHQGNYSLHRYSRLSKTLRCQAEYKAVLQANTGTSVLVLLWQSGHQESQHSPEELSSWQWTTQGTCPQS